jgi:alcohol oxidase
MQLGTCAMKPRVRGGVVDPRLNVYGVQGLKVADLSIGPANVSANTYSTALVIGEKAAVIIAEELGIKGVI